MPLTRKQRRLRAEIEGISEAIYMDHWNIETLYKPKSRSVALEIMKTDLVRGHVVSCYAYIDEVLTDIICNLYFGRPLKSWRYEKLWKTKRFKIFMHYMMDQTSLLNKRATVHAIRSVPNDVWNAIEHINTVRNALAHSLFPENRRRYMADKKVKYKNVPLFSVGGVKKFDDDFAIARRYLTRRCLGR